MLNLGSLGVAGVVPWSEDGYPLVAQAMEMSRYDAYA
jgi:hypothetical protein